MAGSSVLATLLLLTCVLLPFCAAQATCRGRCGEKYIRGQACNCDYNCLSHNECCNDFESLCTTRESCKGRCGETFQRGHTCDCDPSCVPYKTCCPDRQTECTTEMTTRPASKSTSATTQKSTSRKDSKKIKPKESSKKKTTKKNNSKRKEIKTDDRSNTNLCSGLPVNGMTSLRNGTFVIFRGHFFWMLDANRTPGPARSITEEWGIPSPIDTVFTRCNCQGKTFFIKGNNYWRFDNGVMDPGYPKRVSAGFHGLSGTVTAALPVPASKRRPELVFFFKKGGLVQRYSYQPEGRPTCGNRATPIDRLGNQAAIRQGKEINIKLTWRGFPSLVTTAVSVPSPRQPDGYAYYIFSGGKYYNLILGGEGLSLTPTRTPASQQNSVRSWFKCL